MPTPVSAFVLVLTIFMRASTSIQTPKPSETKADEQQADEQQKSNASLEDKDEIDTSTPPPRKQPPDGLLPVAELTRLSFPPSDRPKALLYGTHLLIVGRSGFVEGRDAATGEFAWKLGLPGEQLFDPVVFEAGPLVDGHTDAFTVVLSEPSGHVLLVNGLTGDIQQEARLPFELALPPIRGPDDIVFFATPLGDILAYDVGTEEVSFQTATGETPLALASTDSLLVVSGGDQTLTALDLPAGTLRWTFTGRAGFYAPVAFGRDGARVYAGDDTGELYSLDAGDGTVKFRWSTGAAIRSRALVEGNRLYLASWANTLFAFNASTGDLHWRANLPGRPATSPIRVGNRLLVGTYDGVLVEINPARGQPGKQYLAPGEIVVPPSFFLAKPSPDELAAEAEVLERDADADLEDEDASIALDPEIFGPEEVDRAVALDIAGRDIAGREELSADDEAADQDEPDKPEEPAWFERSRIAMALRSGEVLLLRHKVAQPAPTDTGEAEDAEDAEELGDEGNDAPEKPARPGRPPTSGATVPF
ncbi:MAG: hypothetical protein BMS9Abin37_1880 [Acidobacteriota bacterium]|nr:MAG: hypothetical protein BMS9Abin37_1880 [Acidobacteriota bacterium]